MPKKIIKKFLPKREDIKNQKILTVFGNLLNEPNLWCLNRRSAAGAFAIGLFMAFIPLPSQMIMAAGMAILLKVNLPISVALVWVTNPVTMPVIFYGAYKVGTFLLNTPEYEFHFQLTWDFLLNQMHQIGPPFLLGSLVCGIFFGAVGYFGINALWRLSVVRNWNKRKLRFNGLKAIKLPIKKSKIENDEKNNEDKE